MSKLAQSEIIRQVAATVDRAPHQLPASWFDADVAENMAEWIRQTEILQQASP